MRITEHDKSIISSAANRAADLLNLNTVPEDPSALVRMWRALYSNLGGDLKLMLHWMNTYNTHLKFIPAQVVGDENKILECIEYLEFFSEN